MTRDEMLGDYKIWDNPQAVVWREATKTGYVDRPVNWTKPRPPSYKEMAGSAGVVLGNDRVFLLPVPELPLGSPKPKPRDVIQLDGEDWVVLFADLNRWKTTWRVTTRNFVIQSNLCDQVRIVSQQMGQDAAGGLVVTGRTILFDNLPARIQAENSQIDGTVLGKRLGASNYTVYTSVQIEPGPYWRIEEIGGKSRVLQIVSTINPDRITDLMSMSCEQIP
ncbi:hypothetical protein KIH39_00035 [Telmatocola sphagniphila]|uniref:Uncharacterized protein n=1 Tax=Telmatocola sphagniphila TaxID=1123043 RepID=A0A8E6B886_9BACT|nr:hypothetical protein [Telmatocola sphagniphila]QVL32343.1 hypothetical protein KIH39_00035 [Telmatocola sphagniphila]